MRFCGLVKSNDIFWLTALAGEEGIKTSIIGSNDSGCVINKWQELGPVVLVMIDERLKVCFDMLIGDFGLTIGQRMVSCQKSSLDAKNPTNF